MCKCHCVNQRYLVAALGFFGLLISIGYRADFALVMTHVTEGDHNDSDAESFIPGFKCNTSGTPQFNWSRSTVQDFDSVYFVGSLITQVPGGVLAARFSPKRLCAFMIFGSSVLFIVLPFLAQVHINFVYVIRVLQGLLEGGSIPALVGVISAWAPKTERAILNNIVYAGAYLSPTVGFLATGFSSCVKWNSIFFLAGGLGVVWCVLWMLLVCETPDTCSYLSERERSLFLRHGAKVAQGGKAVAEAIPWRRILTSLPVFAVFVGSFCRNWVFSMMIFQQPQYFKDVFHMSTADIGVYTSIPPLLMTVVCVGGGFFFDKLMEKEFVSRTFGRKLAQTMGFGTEAICLICLYFVDDSKIALVVFSIGVGFSGFAISGYQVNPLDLSPQFAALIVGLSRVGSVGAVLATQVASAALKYEHSQQRWQILWLVAGVIHLVGVIVYDIFASGHAQPWDPSQKTQATFVVCEDKCGVNENDPLLSKAIVNDTESWEKSFEDSLILG